MYKKFKNDELPFPVVGMSDVMPYESFLFSNLIDEKLESYIEVFKNKIKEVKILVTGEIANCEILGD